MIKPSMLLGLQAAFLVSLLISIAFRARGNHFAYGIAMIAAVIIELVGILSVSILFANPSAMKPLLSSFSTMAVFGAHSFFVVATLVSAICLVLLWRPKSVDFATKSKTFWQSTLLLWTLAFVVGLVPYVALTTKIFG